MNDQDALQQDRKIAEDLPRTWPAFFDRFGRLTAVQRASIPAILDGQDSLVVSATASGKTEAACAPLIERYLDSVGRWTVLYVSPTRALVNDLYERLWEPLNRLSLSLRRRTGDYHDQLDDAHVVLTTPESFDSLLCRGRRRDPDGHALANVVAVVLDEVHLFHGSARGEQTRWLLERLGRLRHQARASHWSVSENVQIVALSATIPDPEAVSAAYLANGNIVRVAGGRTVETVTVDADSPTVDEALPAYIRGLSRPEKILVFANARRRVDDLAAQLRRELSACGYQVHAHHGSLDRREREGTEQALKDAQSIVVFSTSTLELGVDIGDIDLVVLDGPAPDMRALMQRMGRGNRRTNITRVMMCSGSLVETIVQSAMIEAAREGWLGSVVSGAQLAVVRQQIASYIYQSPTRSRRRETLAALVNDCLPQPDILAILDKMIADNELAEDGAGIRLEEEWLTKSATGAIHSNIEDTPGVEVVDEETGHTIAKGISHQSGRGLKAGGLLLEARGWADRKLEVRRVKESARAEGAWGYVSRGWLRSGDQPQSVRRYVGIPDGQWPVIEINFDTYAFHFGGAKMRALLDLLKQLSPDVTASLVVNDWYVSLRGQRVAKPLWITEPNMIALEEAIVERIAQLERALGRPRANGVLPLELRLREVRSWLDVDEQLRQLRNAEWITPPDQDTRDLLRDLVGAT